MVAMMAEDMLIDLGCDVVVAMRLDQALAYLDSSAFDLAILDVNLGAARSYPVADALFALAVPFVFATGYGLEGLKPTYRGVPVLQKPYQHVQMKQLLEHLIACGAPSRQASSGAVGFPCACRSGVGGAFRSPRLGS
ncbi:MAG: response regulator [Parafilimonas terrae]|nr:response regulator [Parafilimonas terrae]